MPPIDSAPKPSPVCSDRNPGAHPFGDAGGGVRDLRRATALGFAPAFRDQRTGEIHLCLTERGEIAAVHLFDHLPDHWLLERSADGLSATLAPGVRPGYYCAGRFVDAAELLAQATRLGPLSH